MSSIRRNIAESRSPFIYGTIIVPVEAVAEGIIVRIRGLSGEGVGSGGRTSDWAGEGRSVGRGVASDGGEIEGDGLGGDVQDKSR